MFKMFDKKVEYEYEVTCKLCDTVMRTPNPMDFKWAGGHNVTTFCMNCGMPIIVPISKMKTVRSETLIDKTGSN